MSEKLTYKDRTDAVVDAIYNFKDKLEHEVHLKQISLDTFIELIEYFSKAIIDAEFGGTNKEVIKDLSTLMEDVKLLKSI